MTLTSTKGLVVLALALAGGALAACGTDEPPGLPLLRSSGDARDGGGNGGGEGSGDGASDAGDGGDEAGDSDGDGGADAGQDGVGGDGGGPCAELAAAQPGPEVFEARLNSLPYARQGQHLILGFPTNYSATVAAGLTLQADQARYTSVSALQVRADPERAQGTAERDAKARMGSVAIDLVTGVDALALQAVPAWAGVDCLVRPGRRITAAFGGGSVVWSLEPAVPVALSPRGTPAAYAALLGAGRTWEGLRATAVSSTDPSIPAGTVRQGRAVLRAVDRVQQIPQGSGAPVSVGGDAAFELTLDFGGPAETAALGLSPSTRWFLSADTQAFKAIVVDPAVAGAAPLVFIAGK